MHSKGTAYILWHKNDLLPDFVQDPVVENIKPAPKPKSSGWETVYILGGKRDQISKGDIAGLFMKQGQLSKEELGTIEIKQDCAYAAVQAHKVEKLIALVNNSKLKKKKIRVSVL